MGQALIVFQHIEVRLIMISRLLVYKTLCYEFSGENSLLMNQQLLYWQAYVG